MRRALAGFAVILLASSVAAGQSITFTPVGSVQVAADMIEVEGSHAYVVAENTFTSIDVSNPAAPKTVGSVELPDRVWEFHVENNRAYVADDLHGLEILDLSNPSAPKQVGYFKTKGQAHSAGVFGKRLLVSDHMLGVAFLDITNEAKPVQTGSVFLEGYSRYLAVLGSMVYAVDSPEGFYVIDPSKPPEDYLAGVQTKGAGFGRIISIGLSDPADTQGMKVVVVSGGRALQLYDVTNPSAPTSLASLATPGRGARMALKGKLVYVADNDEGIQVVDISTPSKPRIVANYKTGKKTLDVAVVGSLLYVTMGQRFDTTGGRYGGEEVRILRQNP